MKDLRFIQLIIGEAFLSDDLSEIAEAVHSVAPKCMMWIPTNGLLPEKIHLTTKEIMRRINKPLVGVTISLDGEGDIHDKQRGIDGSYKKAMQTLQLLSELSPISTRYTFQPGSL